MTNTLAEQISIRFNDADVSDVVIDSEFGNVTATVGEQKGVDCGFVETYALNEKSLYRMTDDVRGHKMIPGRMVTHNIQQHQES